MAALRNSRNMLTQLGYLNRQRFASLSTRTPKLNLYGVTTEKAVNWTTTTAVWGATGFVVLVFATDWEQIIRYVPYVKNKIPPKVEEEE